MQGEGRGQDEDKRHEEAACADAGDARPRKIRHDGWTEERQDRFFAHLAETSCVEASAAAAGMCKSSAYRMRARNPAFEARWQMALAEGYAHLEMEMLHRARFGSEKLIVEVDGEGAIVKQTRTKGMNDAVALRLLQHHRQAMAAQRAAAAQLVAEDDAATQRATRKGLEALRRLLGERPGGGRPDVPDAPDAR